MAFSVQVFKMAITQRVLSDPSFQRLFNQQDLRDLFTLSDSGGVAAESSETQQLLPEGRINLESKALRPAPGGDGDVFASSFLAGQEQYVDPDAAPSDSDEDGSDVEAEGGRRGRRSRAGGAGGAGSAPQTAVLQALFGQGQISGAMSHDAAELTGAERSFIEQHAVRVARLAAQSLPAPRGRNAGRRSRGHAELIDQDEAVSLLDDDDASDEVADSPGAPAAAPARSEGMLRDTPAAALVGRLSSRLLWAAAPEGDWFSTLSLRNDAPYKDFSRGRRLFLHGLSATSCFVVAATGSASHGGAPDPVSAHSASASGAAGASQWELSSESDSESQAALRAPAGPGLETSLLLDALWASPGTGKGLPMPAVANGTGSGSGDAFGLTNSASPPTFATARPGRGLAGGPRAGPASRRPTSSASASPPPSRAAPPRRTVRAMLTLRTSLAGASTQRRHPALGASGVGLRSIRLDIRDDSDAAAASAGRERQGVQVELAAQPAVPVYAGDIAPHWQPPLLSGPILQRMAERRQLASTATLSRAPTGPQPGARDAGDLRDAQGRTFSSLLSAMGGRRS